MSDPPQLMRSLWNIKASTVFRPEVIVDVGACSGTTGLYGLFTDPAPLYLLVEPLEERNALLAELMRNHNHRILNCCLSSRQGVARFKVDTAKDSSHLVVAGVGPGTGMRTIQVQVDTLDNVLQAHLSSASERVMDLLVKIDVQGAEPDVLTGGASTLARHNAVVIVEIGTSRENSIQVFSHMDALGYVLVDCIDFVRFPGARKSVSQFDAVFARESLRCSR